MTPTPAIRRWFVRAAWVCVLLAVFSFIADSAHLHDPGSADAGCVLCLASHQVSTPAVLFALPSAPLSFQSAVVSPLIADVQWTTVEKVTRPPPVYAVMFAS